MHARFQSRLFGISGARKPCKTELTFVVRPRDAKIEYNGSDAYVVGAATAIP